MGSAHHPIFRPDRDLGTVGRVHPPNNSGSVFFDFRVDNAGNIAGTMQDSNNLNTSFDGAIKHLGS
jgi:hypothetical protein